MLGLQWKFYWIDITISKSNQTCLITRLKRYMRTIIYMFVESDQEEQRPEANFYRLEIS
jgi:hypothetical protein